MTYCNAYLSRSFDCAWARLRQSTADSAANRQNFASALQEMEDQVSTIHKDTERSRKQIKEGSNKLIKQISESEQSVIKVIFNPNVQGTSFYVTQYRQRLNLNI
jgi:hypothetical protein